VGIRVAVDALGGDRAPLEIVSGALDAATTDIQPVLYGPAGLDTAGLEHVVTDGIVAMHDKPAEAVGPLEFAVSKKATTGNRFASRST
jgi:fatty acid/phospholipid biosynthesis enzyme